MPITLTSPAFGHGETIPKEFTCDGENRSPPLQWSGVPQGAVSLLLVCNDPDAPGGNFHHWLAYNIPPSWTMLRGGFGPESLEPGFLQGVNDFGRSGYGGPCPPKGDKPHAYHFRLTALSTEISSAPDANAVEIMTQAGPYGLDFGELVGFYGR